MTYTVAVCDDEQTQIDILKNNLIKYSIDTDIEFFIDEYISGELLIEKYKSVKCNRQILRDCTYHIIRGKISLNSAKEQVRIIK